MIEHEAVACISKEFDERGSELTDDGSFHGNLKQSFTWFMRF